MYGLWIIQKYLTTAGDGTWILPTERGRMWLTRWQSTTPSLREHPRSSGRTTFSLLSILCQKQHRVSIQYQHSPFINIYKCVCVLCPVWSLHCYIFNQPILFPTNIFSIQYTHLLNMSVFVHLSKLLYELQLFSELLHLSPHGELRIYRFQSLVRPEKHCHTTEASSVCTQHLITYKNKDTSFIFN